MGLYPPAWVRTAQSIFSSWRKTKRGRSQGQGVRGPEDRTDERRAFAEQSPLTAMVGHLGQDPAVWLEVALKPLPETFRISLHRNDREWTIEQVKALGAQTIPWMADEGAFVMPFARGKGEGDAQRMMALLHETGRITRQEAASMLPVRMLEHETAMLALDLCAAPGSKSTQLGERLHPHGVVVANEPVSGRLNMLVSNRSRLGLANLVVTQHDGRHFARLPPPGFDAVLADVPCTGSATTRKNPDVWWDWTPKEGRKMFNLQVDIAQRGASLLVPEGVLVYSTCSVDPVENEAVVAELLRRCPYLELEPFHVEGLTLHPGLTTWPTLNEAGEKVALAEVLALPHVQSHHLSPNDRRALGMGDDTEEQRIGEQLHRCGRLWHSDHDTGGFFVAKFRHRADPTSEGFAPTFRTGRATRSSPTWTPTYKKPPKVTDNSVVPADPEVVDLVETLYGMDLKPYSVWQRGKRLNLAPPLVKQRLYDPEAPTNKGDVWPGGTFHPLRVVHAGLPAFTLKKDSWRSRQEATYVLGHAFSANIATISPDLFTELLCGWAPMLEEFTQRTSMTPPTGAYLLQAAMPWGRELLSVWVGARITLMIDVNEQNILRRKLGLPWREEEA